MDRSWPVWMVTAVFLALLMLLPMGWLVAVSLSGDGGAGLGSYRAALADPHLRKALWNTVVLAFWVGLASVAVGAPLAWLTARTDVPGKPVIRALVMASFVTPPFLGAFAWVMLAGPNAGLLNTLWRRMTGADEALANTSRCPAWSSS
jgi:iron(III) transport system permease protein